MLKAAIASSIMSVVLFNLTYAENSKPLRLMTQYNWASLTDKEKELYVSGVLDGQAALLYEATQQAGPEKVQNMNAMVQCIESEGVNPTTTSVVDSITLLPIRSSRIPRTSISGSAYAPPSDRRRLFFRSHI